MATERLTPGFPRHTSLLLRRSRCVVVAVWLAAFAIYGRHGRTQEDDHEEGVTVRLEVIEAGQAIWGAPIMQPRFSGTFTVEIRSTTKGLVVRFGPEELFGIENPNLGMTVTGLLQYDGTSWSVATVYSIGSRTNKLGLNVPIVNEAFPLAFFGECTDSTLCVFYRTRPIADDLSLFFRRGDVNDDGVMDVSDVVAILSHLFLDDGVGPRCLDAADVNDDGVVEVVDALDELAELFLGQRAIAMPAGFCSVDLTDDDLDCDGSAICETIVSE